VAELTQGPHGLLGESGLEVDLAAVGHLHDLPRGLGRAVVVHARRVAGLLQVHAEIDEVHDDLDVPLGLHVAAHHPEGDPRLAAAVMKAGMMVWNGRLPGRTSSGDLL
jgi:hypothetical protein